MSLDLGQRRGARRLERALRGVCLLAVLVPLLLLAALLGQTIVQGAPRFNLSFLSSYPSRHWEEAGVLPGLVGSLILVALTAAMALPIGVAAAIYLEEYAPRRTSGFGARAAALVEVTIANLAGVPSVIYGLLGLELFVRVLGLGRSVLAGGATLALLVLPVVILSSREALRAVPGSVREAALALGAGPSAVVRYAVLPLAIPGILTGAILSVSRAIGEAAPLLVVGALVYVTFLPDGLNSPFTALPIQIFNWVSRPQEGFRTDAAAGILVLLVTLLAINATAVLLRDRLEKRVRW